ncbi:MAG: putative amidohydrolase YtcJ, partial [Saprospiraceae bacterium]
DLGNAIGVFEERAQNIVRQAYSYYLEEQSDEERLDNWYKGIDLAQKGCLENGITSFQDAGAGFEDMERYRKMADEGAFKIRLWSMLRESASSLKGKTAQERIIGAGDNHFTCRAIKTEVDGALGSFGAWMLESYDDKENFVGQNTTPIEEVEAIAKLAMETDMQLCVHAIGDRANREVLDIMEPYIKSSNKDLRWRIEHSQHISSEDIPRFGSLGVIASMQGIHCTSDSPFVEKRLGRERAKNEAYPWRGLIDNDAVVTNGTDVPVEDINPIESLYASMTRKRIDNGFEFFPENAMTRDEAIYSYTMANAFAAFEENIKGSLEIGKLADITILSQNLRTCSEDSLLDTKILYTIVSGEVLYEAE